MSERNYTDLEVQVLSRFFTGVAERANVYAAKPALSLTVWTFLTGSYSRSGLTMREKFILTLQEIYETEYEATLEALASGADNELDKMIERAERFLSVWAVQYGHNSLKDSCIDRFAVEGISIRATKFIEWVALGAYQEKSTRYADFSNVSFVTHFMPECIRGIADVAFQNCLDAYKKIFEAAFNHFNAVLADEVPHAQVRERTARAKAFDIARYVLPVTTPTSIGITIPSRASEELIRWLICSPYIEAVEIGEKLYRCGIETNQSLIKHVEWNSATAADHPALLPNADSSLPGDLVELRDKLLSAVYGTDLVKGNSKLFGDKNAVRLHTAPATSPNHPRYLSAASLAKERLSLTQPLMSIAETLVEFPSSIAAIFDKLLVKRGPHQAMPHAMGIGELVFSGVIDFGAYRDLQRHRRGGQLRVFPTVAYGYSTPQFIKDNVELCALYDTTIENLVNCGVAYKRMCDNGYGVYDPSIVEYMTVLAHNVEFTYTCTVEQAVYIVELRTSPAGHISYRKFAQAMATCLFHEIPELVKHVNVCWDGDSDRRASEENTQRKLDNLQSKAGTA
jgi:thymidylate synthase ThyX